MVDVSEIAARAVYATSISAEKRQSPGPMKARIDPRVIARGGTAGSLPPGELTARRPTQRHVTALQEHSASPNRAVLRSDPNATTPERHLGKRGSNNYGGESPGLNIVLRREAVRVRVRYRMG